MNLEQVDHCCDLYEARLRAGERLSPEQFLHEQRLPAEEQLLAELKKIERELGTAVIVLEGGTAAGRAPACDPYAATKPPLVEGVGSIVGPYKLLQQIGEGGMGVVYMAEQTEPVSRRVALKIIKPGMDSRQVIARFEAERQALALMDHPNIARVLDAGTTERGRPYFVMELVKGVPITKYCDEKHLNPRERLELFVPICQAVQHAHQKGIIHRDIKPTNVLVAEYDDRPVPKIIDFGVAKAISQRLTERTMFTQYGQIVGTIDYMSPEQASFNQLDVDTRSDVYSLGVLLYELLTGETPFDRKRLHAAAFDELLRIIRQEEPPRPSMRLSSNAALPTIAANRRIEPRKLSLLVRGELDWIVMKAIEKDRGRRYETANGLALDVQRYLSDEPVAACPPSLSYRLQKTARRHRAALGVAGVVLVALIVGLIGTAWQAIRATNAEQNVTVQRDRALTNQKRAEQAEGLALARLEQTQRAEQRAVADRKQAESALFEMNTSSGLMAAERNDAAEAALWFANAAAIAEPGSLEERESRIRVRAWSRLAPTPVRVVSLGFGEELVWMGFDATGEHIATLTRSGSCTIWNLFDESFFRVPFGVTSSAWSTARPELAVGTAEGIVHVLGAPTWAPRQTIDVTGAVSALSFSPDGTRLAIASETAMIWELSQDEFVSPAWRHPRAVRSVQFSPDGTRLLTQCDDGNVRLYDATSMSSDPCVPPMAHAYVPISGQVPVVPRFIGGGRGVLTTTGAGRAIWHDSASGAVVHTIELRSSGMAYLASSPDGRRFIVGGHTSTQIWDFNAADRVGAEISGEYHCGAFDATGCEFALGSVNIGLQRCSALTAAPIAAILPVPGVIRFLEYSPSGRHLATGNSQGMVVVWRYRPATLGNGPETTIYDTGLRSRKLGGSSTRLKTSRSGRFLLPTGSCWPFGDLRKTRVYSMADLQPVGPDLACNALLRDACFSSDEETVISASNKRELLFWNWRTGDHIRSVVLDREPIQVECSPRGAMVVALCVDGFIDVVDTTTGQRLYRLRHGSGPMRHYTQIKDATIYFDATGASFFDLPWMRLLFSSDGRWFVTSGIQGQPGVCVWDAERGTLRYDPLGSPRNYSLIALSPNDRWLAASSGSHVDLFDFESGEKLSVSLEHPLFLTFMTFSPDGDQLLCGSADGSVRLWNWRSGQLDCAPMQHPTDYQGAGAFVSVGVDAILTAGGDGTARLWSRASGRMLAPPVPLTARGWSLAALPDSSHACVTGGSVSSREPHRVMRGKHIDIVPLNDLDDVAGTTQRDLTSLVELLACRRIERSVSTPLGVDEWVGHWNAARASHPELFGTDSADPDIVAWHQRMQLECVAATEWYSAQWHLDRLAALIGANAPEVAEGRVELIVRRAQEFAREGQLSEAANLLREIGSAAAQSSIAPGMAHELNGKAWPLVTRPDIEATDADSAVALASLATQLVPGSANYWNTLGVAYFRAGNATAAIDALTKSAELNAGGSLAYDGLFLAMAYHQLGEPAQALDWYRRSCEWMARNAADNQELEMFRQEAGKLLQAPDTILGTDKVETERASRESSIRSSNGWESDPEYAIAQAVHEEWWAATKGASQAPTSEQMRALETKAKGAPEALLQHASWLLFIGDESRHRELCEEALVRFAYDRTARTQYLLARMVSLSSHPHGNLSQVVELSRAACQGEPSPWNIHTLGLCLYRAGEYEEAVKHLELSLAGMWDWGEGSNWLALALAHQQMGHRDDALPCLREGRKWCKRHRLYSFESSDVHPHDWIAVRLLLREAEALVDPPVAAPRP